MELQRRGFGSPLSSCKGLLSNFMIVRKRGSLILWMNEITGRKLRRPGRVTVKNWTPATNQGFINLGFPLNARYEPGLVQRAWRVPEGGGQVTLLAMHAPGTQSTNGHTRNAKQAANSTSSRCPLASATATPVGMCPYSQNQGTEKTEKTKKTCCLR